MYAGTIVAALCERLVWCEAGVVRGVWRLVVLCG
jgi:hypothetical protein